MRVALCVDALTPQPGGIGRYTWELCKGLAKRKDIEELHFFGRGRLIEEPRKLIEGRRISRRSGVLRAINDWHLKRTIQSSLVHGPNYFLPASAEKGIITVHDLSVFRFPESHPLERVRAFDRLFDSSLRRASHIITDTEIIRQEVIGTFAVSPEMITAVPLGVSDRFGPGSLSPSALASIGLRPGGFGLCVSTLEPRKKILALMEAWRSLPEALRDEFPLVLAGASGWENEFLHTAIQIGVKEGWLHHLGFVDEVMLPTLYAGAALFVYPSSYEGFGLPPLEAMASGTPVVVADRSCLPEVCGDVARYVDPDDPLVFASMLQDSLEDVTWRSSARNAGIRRAARFTWSRCVEETLSVYRNVINLV